MTRLNSNFVDLSEVNIMKVGTVFWHTTSVFWGWMLGVLFCASRKKYVTLLCFVNMLLCFVCYCVHMNISLVPLLNIIKYSLSFCSVFHFLKMSIFPGIQINQAKLAYFIINVCVLTLWLNFKCTSAGCWHFIIIIPFI